MLYYYLLFFFVTVGAKLVLALLMIYLLLPTDRRCGECDEETLLLEGHRLVRLVTRWTPGRLQRRWCPRCGRESFARPAFGVESDGGRTGHPVPIHVIDVDHQ
jgi:hypothetical protein